MARLIADILNPRKPEPMTPQPPPRISMPRTDFCVEGLLGRSTCSPEVPTTASRETVISPASLSGTEEA
ncbi:unnamed protein product [Nippostrongylus brasiliensis]|uniref:Uncharacterized protein n=1 Tax=Nippostrongylus brasiliensis TaxID=27835 RepID=A0A0N4XIX0_NIPBR|nr:unnamed protein product [Nippostrongylus brasiliensis]